MSEASAHKLSYVPETTRGTTPTNPRFQALPDTRTTLALTRETLSSERITGTRFPEEPRSGAKGVGGDIPADLASRSYDDFIASALQGSWVESGGADSVTLDEDGITDNAARAVGDTFATTNGVITVEFVDAKTENLILRFDPTVTGPAESYEFNGPSSATQEIDGEQWGTLEFSDAVEDATVKAGDTRLAFSVLREFSDFEAGEKPYLLYSGCEVATWNLSAAANGLAKSTFTFFGRDMVGPSEDAPGNASTAPAFDTEPFDTFSGAMEIDAVETCIVTDYNVTVGNGHAARYAIGCDISADPSVNMSMVEGSITTYFENTALYEKFVNEESMALKLTLSDSDNNQMVIYMPNCKVGSGTQPDVSADGPITIVINFTAHYDDDLESHISVQRVYPVAV